MKPDYILLEARDGVMAGLILETVEIDIVLTDIRMPNKSGLEFLGELNESGYAGKVVIISGYGQFSYAKEALSKGAFEFLLKPIDPAELSKTLDSAEKSLRSERDRNVIRSRYLDLLLDKMVKSSLSLSEKEELTGILPEQKAGFIFMIKRGNQSEEPFADLTGLRERIKKEMNEAGHVIMFRLIDQEAAVVGMYFLQQEIGQQDIDELHRRLEHKLNQILSGEQFGLSLITEDLFTHAATAYQQAFSALQQAFYLREGTQTYQESSGGESILLKLVTEKEQSLRENIKFAGHREVKAMLTEIFEQIQNEERSNPNRVKEILILTCVRIVYQLQKKVVISDYQKAISSFTKEILEAEHITELHSRVESLFLMLNDIARQEQETDDIISLSQRFIEEHFAEEITLQKLAEKFYFTPSYYSIYFKKKTGKPFSQYILDVRIKKATDKLINSNKKASAFTIYSRIILPLSKSALIVVGLFSFMGVWNDFLGPLVYISNPDKYTVALGLQQFKGLYSAQWHLMMAAAAVVLLPVILVYFIGQKYFVEGIALTGIKG